MRLPLAEHASPFVKGLRVTSRLAAGEPAAAVARWASPGPRARALNKFQTSDFPEIRFGLFSYFCPGRVFASPLHRV